MPHCFHSISIPLPPCAASCSHTGTPKHFCTSITTCRALRVCAEGERATPCSLLNFSSRSTTERTTTSGTREKTSRLSAIGMPLASRTSFHPLVSGGRSVKRLLIVPSSLHAPTNNGIIRLPMLAIRSTPRLHSSRTLSTDESVLSVVIFFSAAHETIGTMREEFTIAAMKAISSTSPSCSLLRSRKTTSGLPAISEPDRQSYSRSTNGSPVELLQRYEINAWKSLGGTIGGSDMARSCLSSIAVRSRSCTVTACPAPISSTCE
mmetsp:Transcript_35880/g.59466  ORF Transcript_35880/g.59466 Transcript_35880/m.59466 type:complete len:264 (+) Transcript_35880:708-1499(+)